MDCRIKTKIINLESSCSLWSPHLPQCVKSRKNYVHKVKKWDKNQVENRCADLYSQRLLGQTCAPAVGATSFNPGVKGPWVLNCCNSGMEAAALYQRPVWCFKWELQSWDLHQQLTVKLEKSTKRKLVLAWVYQPDKQVSAVMSRWSRWTEHAHVPRLLLAFWAGDKYRSLIDFHFRTKVLKWKQTKRDVRGRQSCRDGVQNNHAAFELRSNLSGFRRWLTPGLLAEAATRGLVARGDLSLYTLAQRPAEPAGRSLSHQQTSSWRFPVI